MSEPAADLYISAHLDDVVLSCGGRLRAASREGCTATVVSIFAAPSPHDPVTPFARDYHAKMGIGHDPRVRRREDRAALALLGATPVHLEHFDCIYRTCADGTPLVTSEQEIFLFDPAAEEELTLAICGDLVELMGTLRAAKLFLPLGVGHHRDHVLARWAAERALERLGDDVEVRYFEDVPYVIEAPDDLHAAAEGMVCEPFAITEEELAARLEAISRYASQVDILWHEGDGLPQAVRRLATGVGGAGHLERYWRPADHYRTG